MLQFFNVNLHRHLCVRVFIWIWCICTGCREEFSENRIIRRKIIKLRRNILRRKFSTKIFQRIFFIELKKNWKKIFPKGKKKIGKRRKKFRRIFFTKKVQRKIEKNQKIKRSNVKFLQKIPKQNRKLFLQKWRWQWFKSQRNLKKDKSLLFFTQWIFEKVKCMTLNDQNKKK